MGVKSDTRSLPASVAAAAQRRPPLRLLETRWVCVGDVVASKANVAAAKDSDTATTMTAAAAAAVAAGVLPVEGTLPSTPLGRIEVAGGKNAEGDDDDAAVMSLGDPAAESVWLLAGRTEASYAALRDAVSREGQSREDEQEGEQEQGERLCHMLTLGPNAAGGEAAAASRLER